MSGFVYFVEAESQRLVKIGWTKNVQSRFALLRAGSPCPLILLAAVPAVRQDEWALHERYIFNHAHHEWFHLTGAMQTDIATIALANELPPGFRAVLGQKRCIPTLAHTPEHRAHLSKMQKAAWATRKRHFEPRNRVAS